MFDMNDANNEPAADSCNPLHRRMRHITFLVTGILLALFAGRMILLLREASALQQEKAEVQRSISHRKSIYSIDGLEQEWARYAADVYRAARVVDERSAWGERLGVLSQTIPQGLSLDYISVAVLPSDAGSKVMTLETFVVTKENRGLELARSFVQQLKNEKGFGKEIQINFDEKTRINGKDMEEIQIMVKVPQVR